MLEFFYRDIEKITGMERLRLHSWIEKGIFAPSGIISNGYGTKNKYTVDDIYKIVLIKKLMEGGIHGQICKQIVLSVNFKDVNGLYEIDADISVNINVYNIKNDVDAKIERYLKNA